MATTASVYNASRTTRQVLKRHRKEGPSLTLHLHANTFRFERQNGAFLCESPLKNLLYFIRDQKVPADLVDIFDEARIPFFEGCLIVEIHDHRATPSSLTSTVPSSSSHPHQTNGASSPVDVDDALSLALNPESSYRALGGNYGYIRRLAIDGTARNGDSNGASSPNVYRVVLYPSAETLWSDLRTLNEVEGMGLWSDEDVMEIESRILTLTSPPLCLTPDLQASRIANIMLSATALPSAYTPGPSAPLPFFRHSSDRKRGINSIEVELDEANKKRREKIMRMMQRGSSTKAKETLVGSSTHAPSFSRMAFVERWRTLKATKEANAGKMPDRGLGDLSGSLSIDDKGAAPNGTTTKKKTKKKKAAAAAAAAAEEELAMPLMTDVKESTPPATTPAKKKGKKKAQREKEEREKAEKEQAEREAAAAAAAAAAKIKEEETPKKGKKKTKKEKEQEAQQAAAAAAAMTAGTPTASVLDTPSTTKKQPAKKASKAKKSKVEPSPAATNASLSGDTVQSNGNLGAGMGQAQTPIMFPQQMTGYPMMNPNLAQAALNGSPSMQAAFAGQFSGNTQAINPQQQQLQQAAIQRVLQAQQFQHQQQQQQAAQQSAGGGVGGMNANYMMSAPQIQQQFQALMQQQQLRQQQQQQQQQQLANGLSMSPSQQQGQFGVQDSLPVGVGLSNLPPNWNGMG